MTAIKGLAQALGDDTSGGGDLHVSGLAYRETSAGNVFLEALPQTPDTCIALKSFGGAEADSGLPYDSPIIQILVRGTQDPGVAQELWYDIYDKLHGAVQITLPDGTLMISALVLQSSPINIGPDTNGRVRFSMNVQLETVNATANRPAPQSFS